MRSSDFVLVVEQTGKSNWIVTDRPVPMQRWWHLILNCITTMRVYFDGTLISETSAPTITYSTGDKEIRIEHGPGVTGSYRDINIFGKGQELEYIMSLRNM